MTKSLAPEIDPVLYKAAHEVAREAADYDGPLYPGYQAVNSAVFYDGSDTDPQAHTMAVRVQWSDKTAEETLERVRREVAVATALSENGALVQRFIGDACLHAPSGVVGTVSRYLPQKPSMYGYGSAIGTLHKASAPTIVEHLPAFDPLGRTGETYTYLRELYESGGKFVVGGEVLPVATLDTLSDLLAAGKAAVHELLERHKEQGLPLVALQQDVSPGNVLADSSGRPHLIDLDHLAQGPAVYDLTRPYDNWHRFGRPPRMTDDFLKGYYDETCWPFSMKMMKLALRINHARYTSSLLTKVVDQSRRGQDMSEVSPFYVAETINRIDSIETDLPWLSEHEWKAAQSAAQDLQPS